MTKDRIIWAFDREVAECFDSWEGEDIARFYEALRFREQLSPGKLFIFKATDIRKYSGLPIKRQLEAKRVLVGSGWIETVRTQIGMLYRITPLAKDATKLIPHRRNLTAARKAFAQKRDKKWFSTAY